MIRKLIIVQLLLTLNCPVFVHGSEEVNQEHNSIGIKRPVAKSAFSVMKPFGGDKGFIESPSGVAINLSEIQRNVEMNEDPSVDSDYSSSLFLGTESPVTPQHKRAGSGRFTPLEPSLKEEEEEFVSLEDEMSKVSIGVGPATVNSRTAVHSEFFVEDVESDDSEYELEVLPISKTTEPKLVPVPVAEVKVNPRNKYKVASTRADAKIYEDFPFADVDLIEFPAFATLSDRFHAAEHYHDFLRASENFIIPRKLKDVPVGIFLLKVSLTVRRFRKSFLTESELHDGVPLADAIIKCSMPIHDLIDVTENLMRAGMTETSIELLGTVILPFALQLRRSDKLAELKATENAEKATTEKEKSIKAHFPSSISFLFDLATSGRLLILQDLLSYNTIRHYLLRALSPYDISLVLEILLGNGSLSDGEVWRVINLMGLKRFNDIFSKDDVDRLCSLIQGKRSEKLFKAIRGLNSK